MKLQELKLYLDKRDPEAEVLIPNQYAEDGLHPVRQITETLEYELTGQPFNQRVVIE